MFVIYRDEQILSQAVFAENMLACAKVKPKILSVLSSVLRSGCEFGIDFEIALGMRRHLQKLYGFSNLPSLSQVSVLCSDLQIIALSNIAPHSTTHMRELEQWLDFLIDFFFQESVHGYLSATTETVIAIPKFPLVSSKSKETDLSNEPSEFLKSTCHQSGEVKVHYEDVHENVEQHSNESIGVITDTSTCELNDEMREEKNSLIVESYVESNPVNEQNTEKKGGNSCNSSQSSSECLSEIRTSQDDDQLIKQQMAAALESYRKQKRLQTKIIHTEPPSPRAKKV